MVHCSINTILHAIVELDYNGKTFSFALFNANKDRSKRRGVRRKRTTRKEVYQVLNFYTSNTETRESIRRSFFLSFSVCF